MYVYVINVNCIVMFAAWSCILVITGLVADLVTSCVLESWIS